MRSNPNMVNTYVVAPNFSTAPPPRLYRPDDTPPPANQAEVDPFSRLVELQLGDVLADPFGAEFDVINRDARTKIDAMDVEKLHRDEGFHTSRKELLSGRLGVCASLFAALGIGPDLNISIYLESRAEDTLEVETLETRRFRVTEDYVKEVLKSDKVAKHVKKYSCSHLYMVSGMKIAKGAKGEMEDELKAEANGGAGNSTGAVDVKLLKFLRNRWRKTSFKAASDFVLAVQLRRIEVGQDDPNVTLSTKHATMADSQKAAEAVNLKLKGLDDNLEVAERRFFGQIEKRQDEGGDSYMIPLTMDDDEEDEDED
ncbi:hypothetical protein F5Y13DRAFT_150059 [Hypoxylon sp. FL1857]|nr:hypothetical protein F5Y13DRAFT_150059 [Hypoxylon sp. FL1857]